MNKRNSRTGLNRLSSIPRKKLMWVLLAVLLIGSTLVVLEKTGVTNFIKLHDNPPADSSGATAEQKQQEDAANAESKKQAADEDKGAASSASSNTTPATSIDLRAEQAANNTVTVFTTLKGYSDGSCLLTVTNAGKTTTLSASVIYQKEASSCAGFSVPVDPLGKGAWTLSLAVTSNGTTSSKDIGYEVK